MQKPSNAKAFISGLYDFLGKKGVVVELSEDDFVKNMQNQKFADGMYKILVEKELLNNVESFDQFYRPFQDYYAESKKKVGTPDSGAGLPGAEVRDGFVVEQQPEQPIRQIPRREIEAQDAGVGEVQAAGEPVQAPERANIPAPIAPGREAEYVQREQQRQAYGFPGMAQQPESEAAIQQRNFPGFPTQEQQPFKFGQKESDFPIKSANTAIKELEEARADRRQGQRTKPTDAQAQIPESKVASFFDNTRVGQVLSQGGAGIAATGNFILQSLKNVPELLANVTEDISLEFAGNELEDALKAGKITQEDFNAQKNAMRQAYRGMQIATGQNAPRALEWVMDNYLNADDAEDAARANLEKVAAKVKNADKGFEGLYNEGRYADAIQYATTQGIVSLPYMLTAMLPGGSFIVAGATAQDKYRQIQDTGVDMGAKEALNAVATGAIEGLTEAASAGLAKQAAKLVAKLGKEAATKTLKQQLGQLGKRVLGATLEESASELFAQLSENIIDKATIDPNKDVTEGLMDAGVIGAISGAGTTAAIGGTGLAVNRAMKGRAGEAQATTPTAPEPTTPDGQDINVLTMPQEGEPIAPGTPVGEGEPTASEPTASEPTASEPTEPVQEEITPEVQRYRSLADDVLLGTGRTATDEAVAQELIDEYLDTLSQVDEDTMSMVPPAEGTEERAIYNEVMVNRDNIAKQIIEQSKPKTDATKEVEVVQPEGGEQQYPGTEKVGEEAPAETDTGDRPLDGGVQQGEETKEIDKETRDKLPDNWIITPEQEAAQATKEAGLLAGSAKQRRQAGSFIENGVKYERQPVDTTSPRGAEGEVVFAEKAEGTKKFRYKLVEAEKLQPSHLGNVLNPMHFIPEAQPKDRSKGLDSVKAQADIAYRTNVNRLGASFDAYAGAPIVNARNEVIQGNNRVAGIRLGYGSNSFGNYKNWLTQNAAQFGFTPEQVAGMNNPTLVREVDVDDDTAIRFGQYRYTDIETGGANRPDPKSVATKISDEDRVAILSVLYADPGKTLKESIRANWKKLLSGALGKYISNSERNFMIKKDGSLSQDGADVIEDIAERFIFDDAPAQLPAIFEQIPYRIQNAIRKGAGYIFSVPREKSLLAEVQTFIQAYHKFHTSGISNLDAWLDQSDMFSTENVAPRSYLDPLTIEWMRRAIDAKESQIIKWFLDYAIDTRPATKDDIFAEQKEVLSKRDAILKHFNIDINEKRETDTGADQGGGDVLGTQQPTGTEMVEGAGTEEAGTEQATTELEEPVVIEPEPFEGNVDFTETAAVYFFPLSEAVLMTPTPESLKAEPGTVDNPIINMIGETISMIDVDKVSEDDAVDFMAKQEVPPILMRKYGVDAKEGKIQMIENVKKNYQRVKQYQKIAAKLGVKIYLGTSNNKAYGFHQPYFSGGKVRGFVYINAIFANPGTFVHELAHVAVSNMLSNKYQYKNDFTDELRFKFSNETLASIENALRSTQDQDIIQLLDQIKNRAVKLGYKQESYIEEHFAETIALLHDGLRGKLIDNTTLGKLERAVNKILDAILGKGLLNVRFSKTQDFLDFLKALSQGIHNDDVASIDEAMSLFAQNRVRQRVQGFYWKGKEVVGSRQMIEDISDRIEQGEFRELKGAESIVNEILAGTFGIGRYIVKFSGKANAKGFFKKIDTSIEINGVPVPSSHIVRAEILLGVNDYLKTIATAQEQIKSDLDQQQSKIMQDYYDAFPPVKGGNIDQTAEEQRMVESMQTRLDEDAKIYDARTELVNVPTSANQDNLKGKPMTQRVRMLHERTGSIPSVAAITTATSPDPHGMYSIAETMQSKVNAIRRGVLDKKDAVKAIFAHAFGDAKAHLEAVMANVKILDPALFHTAKEAGKNYYMLDGHAAASLLLNSEAGQRYVESVANGQTDMDFEQDARQVLAPFGIDADAFFKKVSDAIEAYSTGGIKAAEKSLGSGKSLQASILGMGDVSKKEAADIEKHLVKDSAVPVKTTGFEGLDSRADAIASALNMDAGLVREAMRQMAARHLTEPADAETFEDTLVLTDDEFYAQLKQIGAKVPESMVSYSLFQYNPYENEPYYKQARNFIWNELSNGTPDKKIVEDLVKLYATNMNGFDARDFFEFVSGRKYREQVDLSREVSDAQTMFFRNLLRLNIKGTKLAISRLKKLKLKDYVRDEVYEIGQEIFNDLAMVRKLQRDVERKAGSLMPEEKSAYQKMQLYVSAAASEIQKFTDRFYGNKKTTTTAGIKDSFISRLARSGVKTVNEFNAFLTSMHKQERIDRLIDIQERFLLKLYEDFRTTAIDIGASQMFPIDMQDIADYDEMTMLSELNRAYSEVNDKAKRKVLGKKLIRFNKEVQSLNVGYQRKNVARREFIQYLTNKGVKNPASVKPGDLKGMPEFADHFAFMDEFKNMQKEYLDILYETGQLNEERYDHLLNGTSTESGVVWEYYVPLIYDEYVYGDEIGVAVKPSDTLINRLGIKPLTKLMGKKKATPPAKPTTPISPLLYEDINMEKPVEVLFHRMTSAIRLKHRNDAIKTMARLMQESKDPNFKIFSSRVVPKKDRWGNSVGVTDLITPEIKNQSQVFFEDGKRKYIYFSNPDSPILKKLKGGLDDSNAFERLFRHVNNLSRGLFTSYRPSFIVNSLFRDAQEAAVNIQVEGRTFNANNFRPGTPEFKRFRNRIVKAYGKRYLQAAKYMTQNLFNRQGDPQMNSYFQELQQLGGLMSWSFSSMDIIRDQVEAVKENIQYAERFAAGKTKGEYTKRFLTNTFIESIHNLSNNIEAFARLATYAAMRDVGVEPIRAAEMAKNVTINFEKKGANKTIRSMNGIFLFLNPALQGVGKMGKQVASPEGRKALLAYTGLAFTLRSLVYSLPGMVGWITGDDEDEEKVRTALESYFFSQYVSESKLLIPNPLDAENPLMLPKPFGAFRISAAVGEGIADLAFGYKTPGDVTMNLLRQMKASIDVIGGTASPTDQPLAYMPVPILSPVYETIANQDRFGRAIVYDISGSFDFTKANKNTPQIYKDIAREIYINTPNHMDFSPASLEHVFEEYMGLGAAQFIKNSREVIKDVAAEEDKGKAAKRFFIETAFINRVLYNDNISKDDKNDLYNYLSMATTPLGRWNETKVKYAEKTIELAREKELVNENVLQSSLDDVLTQIVTAGKLNELVPGQEITWEQWYSYYSNPKGNKTQRQIDDKIFRTIEEVGVNQR